MTHALAWTGGLTATLAAIVLVALSLAAREAAAPRCRDCGRPNAVDHTGVCEPCREKA